jgi:hypothetical protein
VAGDLSASLTSATAFVKGGRRDLLLVYENVRP